MKKNILLFVLIFCYAIVFAQNDSTNFHPAIFDRIAKSTSEFQLDTTEVPADKITKKIIELRKLRGGFNINEAIDFKLQEDKQKGEVPAAEMEKLTSFFRTGAGKRWLDNAVIWIYRRHFTYNELNDLVKFYKTPGGRKMATDFPLIMMESLRASEMIKEAYEQQQKSHAPKP